MIRLTMSSQKLISEFILPKSRKGGQFFNSPYRSDGRAFRFAAVWLCVIELSYANQNKLLPSRHEFEDGKRRVFDIGPTKAAPIKIAYGLIDRCLKILCPLVMR